MASRDLSGDPERRGQWLTRPVLELHDPGIDRSTAATLARYQSAVDAAGGYAEQVKAAAAEFTRRNRKSNPAFRVVRTRLERMCASPGRCAWLRKFGGARDRSHPPQGLYPGRPRQIIRNMSPIVVAKERM